MTLKHIQKLKKHVRTLVTPLAFVFGVIFILPILYIFELVYPLRFSVLFYNRIGHLAINTEIFCRRLQLGLVSTKFHYLFLTSRPANEQLLKMYKRVLNIWDSSLILRVATFFLPLLERTRFYQEIPVKCNEYYEFAHGKSSLSFTDEEELRGREELKKMGIGTDDWFVLIHARDPNYMKEKILAHQASENQKWNYEYNYRDCKIENYLLAAEYITSQGGYVIRMGDVVDAPLNSHNLKIIDYAIKFRSDFMDIYLCAKAKFFLGCTSGLCMVPTIFDVPVAQANYIPYPHTPFSIQDIFITKLTVDKKSEKILSYSEAAQRGLMGWEGETSFYEKKDVYLVENSSEEILDLCQEMNEEINMRKEKNISKIQVPQTELQLKYKKNFLPIIFDKSVPIELSARLANSFLKRYPQLM